MGLFDGKIDATNWQPICIGRSLDNPPGCIQATSGPEPSHLLGNAITLALVLCAIVAAHYAWERLRRSWDARKERGGH